MGVDTDDKFDALNKVIKNVFDGSADTDAVNVKELNSLTASAVTTANNAVSTVNQAVTDATNAKNDAVSAKNDAEQAEANTLTLKVMLHN